MSIALKFSIKSCNQVAIDRLLLALEKAIHWRNVVLTRVDYIISHLSLSSYHHSHLTSLSFDIHFGYIQKSTLVLLIIFIRVSYIISHLSLSSYHRSHLTSLSFDIHFGYFQKSTLVLLIIFIRVFSTHFQNQSSSYSSSCHQFHCSTFKVCTKLSYLRHLKLSSLGHIIRF